MTTDERELGREAAAVDAETHIVILQDEVARQARLLEIRDKQIEAYEARILTLEGQPWETLDLPGPTNEQMSAYRQQLPWRDGAPVLNSGLVFLVETVRDEFRVVTVSGDGIWADYGERDYRVDPDDIVRHLVIVE